MHNNKTPRVIDSHKDCILLHSNLTRDESALVLVHSKLSQIARRFDVPDLKRENMLLVASEIVTNNIKHAAGRGQIQVWLHPGPVLDIVSLDYGPGINNLALAQSDGFSSSNTFGKGLGAIRRLSDESYVYTQPRQSGRASRWSGTALMARFNIVKSKERMLGSAIGIFSRALTDTPFNGDRIYIQRRNDILRWLHMDGMGHGEDAEFATSNLSSLVAQCEDLSELIDRVDHKLSVTRGAVAIAGELNSLTREVNLLGVGDMHAHFYIPEHIEHLSFAPGILGRAHRSKHSTEQQLLRHSRVLTASDGIRRNWDMDSFSGLFELHPQLIAYVLGNIMGRMSDDQSLCVLSVR